MKNMMVVIIVAPLLERRNNFLSQSDQAAGAQANDQSNRPIDHEGMHSEEWRGHCAVLPSHCNASKCSLVMSGFDDPNSWKLITTRKAWRRR